MKKVLLFVAVVGFIGMTSCKKCEDCTAMALGTSTGQTQEFCGDELDAAKDSYNAALESGWLCE